MAQINWTQAPSLAVKIILPAPPATEDVAVGDWMAKAQVAIETLAQGNHELQSFLDDLLEAVQPVQLIANDVQILAGEGSPENVITARVGSVYLQTDGGVLTSFWVKETGTGSSGWGNK